MNKSKTKVTMENRMEIGEHSQGYLWNVLEETSLQLMPISSSDIKRGNMGTHQPSKEQASSNTNKDGKGYVKHHINRNQGKRQSETQRDNRWTLRVTTWKPYERKIPRGRPSRRWSDELDDYWKRIAQDRQMWKQHAEAFA